MKQNIKIATLHVKWCVYDEKHTDNYFYVSLLVKNNSEHIFAHVDPSVDWSVVNQMLSVSKPLIFLFK